METLTSKTSHKILSKYMTFEGNTATVHLYFDTFSELIDQNLGGDKVEKLNDTLLEKVDDIMSVLPKKYKLHVLVHIRDLENYSIEEAQRIIKENVELNIYVIALEHGRKRNKAIVLLIVGCLLLLTSYLLGKLEWPQILYDVINISGTLLVWEAANLALIEQNDKNKRALRYLRQLKEVRIVDTQA